MAQQAQDIEVPPLMLRSSSTDEYCRALRACKRNAFWAYQEPSAIFGLYGRPYQDSEGIWWYQVRPGFSWPADALAGLSPRRSPPFRGTYLGYQHCVPEGSPSNCSLVINVILNLAAYGAAAIDFKKRNKVRQGLKLCDMVLLERPERELIRSALEAWNSLVQRTGWKHIATEDQLFDQWSELLDLPATSILLAIDHASGRVAGFIISKIFGDTAYIDTIASNTELLSSKPNDALVFTFLKRAMLLAGVTRAHYAIKSTVTQLEEFKTSMGFVPHPFPAMLRARPGLFTMLRVLKPAMYKRLTGQLD